MVSPFTSLSCARQCPEARHGKTHIARLRLGCLPAADHADYAHIHALGRVICMAAGSHTARHKVIGVLHARERELLAQQRRKLAVGEARLTLAGLVHLGLTAA